MPVPVARTERTLHRCCLATSGQTRTPCSRKLSRRKPSNRWSPRGSLAGRGPKRLSPTRSSGLAPAEVLVSGTVRDLVVGSGLEFDDRGEHELRGIESRWRLLVARPAGGRAG